MDSLLVMDQYDKSPTPNSDQSESSSSRSNSEPESDEALNDDGANTMHSGPPSPLPLLPSLSSLSSEEAWPDARTAPAQLPIKDPLPATASTTTLLVEPYHPLSQELLGKIQVNNNKYDILKVMFSSTSLIGRGTVCYQARRASDGQGFVIKDHWVLWDVDDVDVLNEIMMMKAMDDIPGVPKLEEYCKVMLSSEVDNTWMYCYLESTSLEGTWHTHVRLVIKPQAQHLQEFKTRKELVQALLDIMINDGSSNDDHYSLGGTGMVPFLSWSVLGQLAVWDKHSQNSCHFKVASDSQAISIGSVKQDFMDNLESLFYVFMWICIMFSGPLSKEHDITLEEDWLPYEWSHMSLRLCQNAKNMYFFNIRESLDQFDPYFAPLLLLMCNWTDFLHYNFPSTNTDRKIAEHKPVMFDDVIELLDKHLALLPDNELSPEHLFRQTVMNKNIQDVADRADIIKKMQSGAAITTSIPQKKCGLNDTGQSNLQDY
ncbi:uncharacterized protein BJ212DRAFT_1306011 [Suillus subaureus]|uniref:Fungal-type protein kinase domain-containing protein n=1 Tax=Suillus subaureus TaxID=48587 RepID=A0A9P7IYQ2_9AGAM|nr:uncharacterized protein BJ212DRAFT_1306011 [Suillus subaureus]KAG1797525.1 hypothetical protein BJ212DRAFT_1306011 [Suillus subaureus]